MTFLNPIGLVGLLSLPVILALHLLRKRQRPYVVSHLGLWSFLDRETRGPRRRRLPLTWLLLLDLLIAALFSLAWAQPRLALNLPLEQARHLVILLDVSSSMRAEDGLRFRQTRFEQAQAEALALLDSAGPRDTITLLTFGSRAALVADSRQDGDALRQRLRDLRPGETGSALRAALALGHAALDPALPASFHVFSDGSFPEEHLGAGEAFAYPLRWHLVGGLANNQAVIELNAAPVAAGSSLSAANAAGQYQIFARIANFGSRRAVREVLLQVDGRTVDRQMIDLPADSSLPRVWQIPAGGAEPPGAVTVRLGGSDVQAADDSAVIGLHSGGAARVALVADDPALIAQAVQAAPGVELILIPPAEYAAQPALQRAGYDLTIFRAVLPERWPSGQVLLIEPPRTGSGPAAEFAAVAGREIAANSPLRVPTRSPLVAGIDFSGVRWTRALSLAQIPPGFTPLLLAGEAPLLLQGEVRSAAGERSRVVVLLADLASGNFTRHPAFPILVANLVEHTRQAPLPAGFRTGERLPLPPPGAYRQVEITAPDGQLLALDESAPAAWHGALEPGLYRFRFTAADGAVREFAAGAMAGDESESDLRPRAWLEAAQDADRAAGAGTSQPAAPLDLRPWLLGAAILILLVEAVLAWRR